MSTCTIDGCEKRPHGHGLCSLHYNRQRNHGRTDANPRLRKPCAVDGCARKSSAKTYCMTHYARWRDTGDPHKTKRVLRARGARCTVADCDKPEQARAMCCTHYSRWRIFGDPLREPTRVRGRRKRPDKYLYRRNGRKNELAHRLVMEEQLGRPLTRDESVHHKNGDGHDNRPENLELWSRWQPSGQRVDDKVAWAKELLARYQPEPEWIGAGC